MFEPNSEVIASKLRTLNTVDPQRAMDEIDRLIEHTSIMRLAQILKSTYWEISEELRIDWRFTAMQWKIGNRGEDEFKEVYPGARFKVWSFPEGQVGESQKRYATCLPFQFKDENAFCPTTVRTL
jgi:hypothetical protein